MPAHTVCEYGEKLRRVGRTAIGTSRRLPDDS